jgi:hypothetical protein
MHPISYLHGCAAACLSIHAPSLSPPAQLKQTCRNKASQPTPDSLPAHVCLCLPQTHAPSCRRPQPQSRHNSYTLADTRIATQLLGSHLHVCAAACLKHVHHLVTAPNRQKLPIAADCCCQQAAGGVHARPFLHPVCCGACCCCRCFGCFTARPAARTAKERTVESPAQMSAIRVTAKLQHAIHAHCCKAVAAARFNKL